MPVFGTQMFGGAAGKTAVAYSFTDSGITAGNASSFTFSSMAYGTADDSRIIAVTVSAGFSNVYGAISGVTIGGVTATIIVQGTNQEGGTSSIDTSTTGIVAAAVPTGTSGDVVVTLSRTTNSSNRGCGIGVYRLTGPGVVAANDTATAGINSCSNQTLTVSVDTEEDGAAIACSCGSSSLGSETWTGLTENNRGDAGAAVNSTAGAATTSDESPRTISVATGSYCNQSAACASWVPA
tara:strand:+ start:56 stop:769 length:714 start_codon:yes stop_codon:yes gene_type:complete